TAAVRKNLDRTGTAPHPGIRGARKNPRSGGAHRLPLGREVRMAPDVPPSELPLTPSPETVHAHDVSWRKWRRYQRWKYVAMLLGGVLLGLMVCAVIVLVVVVIGQNSKRVTLAKQNHDNTENTAQAV